MVEKVTKLRCAIYTRKSTEDGLEQDFNSLDAQREACAAYILSQTSEGWEPVTELYDDGGYSGGSMKRPGLQQLLGDVKAKKVDVIVVYKVDRLTRSLADFAKIVEILDDQEASFVSVTQSFNTTTSMGRLTLNVLLSFAQFEREVTGERIRDKIAASKKKGMWMGGPVPIGYDLKDRKLVISDAEAKTVRHLFTRYSQLRSVPQLVEELAAAGVRTKMRQYKNGRQLGGVAFRTGALSQLLKNPIYTGKVRHKEAIYDGEHDAIIDQDLFDEVQSIFAANRSDNALGKKSKKPRLLTGLTTDPDGRPMTPVHASRRSKRYRYYVTRLEPGADKNTAWRMPSGEIERLVVDAVVKQLSSLPSSSDEDAALLSKQIDQSDQLKTNQASMNIADKRSLLLRQEVRVQVNVETVLIGMIIEGGEDRHQFTIGAKLVSRGSELKLAISPDQGLAKRQPDPVLLRLIAQAFAARDYLVRGNPQPMVEHYSRRHLHQLVRLSYLAPDIISAIINGTQPPDLTGRKITRQNNIPLDWAGQRSMFGFG